MNTRIEKIGYVSYCAYCGKQLRDDNCGYAMYPEQPMICNCEKAKEELALYDSLKKLYNAPIAESLIDKKVQKYRNELLGIKEPSYGTINLASATCVGKLDNTVPTLSADNTIAAHVTNISV